jgi:hypothetical protein
MSYPRMILQAPTGATCVLGTFQSRVGTECSVCIQPYALININRFHLREPNLRILALSFPHQ